MIEPPPLKLCIADIGALHRLTFAPDRDPALTAELVQILGWPLPSPQQPSGSGSTMLIWQGPHDFLIAGAIDGTAITTAIIGRAALFGDAARGLVAFDLVGDALDERLGHDRPAPGLCSRVMRLAALRVTAIWSGASTPDVRLLVDRSHADYLRHWLCERWHAVEFAAVT